jgi:hypothetical protein
MTETTLWTNPSPSSSLAGGDVTLSQSIANYDLLKFTWRYSTDDTTSIITYVDVPTYRANSKSASGSAGKGINPSCLIYTGSANYVRTCYYTSDTKTYIGVCGRVGSSSTSNTSVILKSIKGIKLS